MKKTMILMATVLLGALMLFSGASDDASKSGQIKDFVALDAPHDGGDGVILKWTPLDKTHRIIQYKLYRGVSPDTLFYFNSIDVDPVLGVIGNELTFIDQDFQPLFEFETAPSKLKKEKHQPANSPLYQAVPRDAALIGKLVPYYQVLGAINHKVYYHQSKKIGEGDDTLAGYRLNQFDFIYANPMPDSTYYYSVVAVNERGKHMPAAEVVSVIPFDNRPSDSATLTATLIQDTHEIGFEWSPPESGDDLMVYSGWLIPRENVAQFKAEQEQIKASDELPFGAWKGYCVPLFQAAAGGGTMYQKVALSGLERPLSRPVESYLPLISYQDYSGFENAAVADTLYIRSSSELPKLPAFSVWDKENDKGDNLLISFGKPVVYLTQASYTSAKKNKLKFNYEVLENDRYPIERLKFTFTDANGKPMGTIVEYYPDKLIYLKVPPDFNGTKSFKVETQVMLRSHKGKWETPAATQDIEFEDATRRYLGKNLTLNGQQLDMVFLDVLRKSKFGSSYNPGLRSNGMVRAQDHPIPYPDMLYKQITGYDKESNRLLTDHSFPIDKDEKSGAYFMGSIYRDVFDTGIKESKAHLDSLNTVLKAMTAIGDTKSEEYLMTQMELDHTKATYDFIINHKAYKAASKARGERSWRKTLLAEANRNSRTYSYQLLISDGHGFFQQTQEPYADATGRIWFTPIAQWFDMTKLGTLIGSLLFGIFIVVALVQSKRKELYIRPIAGLEELDNAVGRATEMGRPVMFVPGWGTLGEPCTISSMMILAQTARKTAEFDVRLISPHCDYFVMPVAQEIVQTAYSEAGRPDAFDRDDIFYISDSQFAFSAGVNGITIRERVATILYMGFFNAEALLMTETGNQAGAIQIAGTDATTQVPFFITTCDYTLIGEEFYAASAYLSRNIELVSMLKGLDYFKLVMVILVIAGTILSTVHWHGLLHFLPFE